MKLLYAEDELSLSMAVTEILKMENFIVDAVYDGEAALQAIYQNTYDAIILDIMMPKLSGIEVVEKIREKGIYTPVLLLTAKNETEDRIHGLSCGADDYIGKPFDMGEFVTRIQVLLRRANTYKETTLSYGNVQLNCQTAELQSIAGSLRLSSKEAQLLTLLLKQTNIAHSSRYLLENVWDANTDPSTLTLYISYLQNKLKQIHSDCTIQPTKEGYILQSADSNLV